VKYLNILVIAFVMSIINNVYTVSAESRMSEIEFNSDRYGQDYASFDLKTSDPTLCEEKCATDPRCLSWTYIKPNTVQGPNPRCWLKSGIQIPRLSFDCVSGLKITERRTMMAPQILTDD